MYRLALEHRRRLFAVLIATIAALAWASVAAAGGGATNPPSLSSYTDAQLRSLAATPSAPQDDSMSFGTPAPSAPQFAGVKAAAPMPAYFGCWYDTRQAYHGTWPQEQQVYLNTHWCGSRDQLVQERDSYVTMHTTTCSSHDPYNVRVGGGVGTRYVDVEGGAYFDCPTGIPWVQTHWHVWLIVRYWGGGGVQVIDRCGGC